MNTMIYLKNKKRKNHFSSFTEMLKVSHEIRVAFVEKNVVSRHPVLTTKELPPNPPQFLLQISKTLPTPHPPKNKLKQDIFRC